MAKCSLYTTNITFFSTPSFSTLWEKPKDHKPKLCTLLSTVMWPRRKMMYHTLGTIYALVAIHTNTNIIIYSVSTRCIVFARIRGTVVIDNWKRGINGRKFAICIRTLVYIFKIQASFTKRTEKSFQLRFRVP